MISTIDLLILFVKKVNNIFSLEKSCSELVSARRSTLLNLPLQEGFPWVKYCNNTFR
jgi:hypothetical protein